MNCENNNRQKGQTLLPIQHAQRQELQARKKQILENFTVSDLDNPVTLNSIQQILGLIDQKLIALTASAL